MQAYPIRKLSSNSNIKGVKTAFEYLELKCWMRLIFKTASCHPYSYREQRSGFLFWRGRSIGLMCHFYEKQKEPKPLSETIISTIKNMFFYFSFA
jgi:hypothetical protein